LVGEVFLGLDGGVVDLVIAFDFDDDEGAILGLDEEVGIVGAESMGVGINILHIEFGLAVGEHAGEVEVCYLAIAEEAPEEVLLRLGVETVGVEVEALGSESGRRSVTGDGEVGLAADLVVAFGWVFDKGDFVRLFVGVGVDFVDEVEEARDYPVMEELVEEVDVLQDTVRAFGGGGEDLFDLEAGFVEITGDFGDKGEVGITAALTLVGDVLGGSAVAGDVFLDSVEEAIVVGEGLVEVQRRTLLKGLFLEIEETADAL